MQRSTDTEDGVTSASTATNTTVQSQGDATSDSGPDTLSQSTTTTEDNSNNTVVPLTSSNQATNPQKSGAIAGGVVGGLAAVLMILSLGVVYRRRKIAADARPTEPVFNTLDSDTGNGQDRQTKKPDILDRQSPHINQDFDAGVDVARRFPVVEADSDVPTYLPYHPAELDHATKELASSNVRPNRPTYQSFQYQPAHTNNQTNSVQNRDFSEPLEPQVIIPALRGHHSLSSIMSDGTNFPVQHSATTSRPMSPETSTPQQQRGTRFSELEAHTGNSRQGRWPGMLELP